MTSGFDRIARAYRWMEYLSFGPLLQRCRLQCLPYLTNTRHALVLGDGDGRFCARLLRSAPAVVVDAVDSSPAMLQQLRTRFLRESSTRSPRAVAAHRLRTHCLDATCSLPLAEPYDAVATHFFLDCLSVEQIAGLADRLGPCLLPGAVWVVSEFAIPSGLLRWPAAFLIGFLYRSFRILTGLRTQTLPDHAPVLTNAGFTLRHRHRRLGGILIAELWQFMPLQQAWRSLPISASER